MSVLLTQTQYRLVVIKEEAIPLAASAQVYFPAAVAAMIAVAAILLAAFYVFLCTTYRKRLRQLGAAGEGLYSWRLCSLKKAVSELETEKLEENFAVCEPF